MKGMAASLDHGQTRMDYELVRSARRSLEIAVHPDKRVVVRAPAAMPLAEIEASVRQRAGWIARKLAYFEQFAPRTPPRRYVGGESHLYLGRQYRLKLHPAERDQVTLQNGYFHIACRSSDPRRIKRLLDAWYDERAAACFAELFEACWQRFGGASRYQRPTLKLRRMKSRWGSLSARGRLTLNLQLIQAPMECIEYVIFHELCHLAHHNHGRDYYALLDRTLPDWRERKKKLELTLA